MRIATGENSPNGMLDTACLASPEPLRAYPRANPPATIQITDQLISSKSRRSITPVSENITNGTRATV